MKVISGRRARICVLSLSAVLLFTGVLSWSYFDKPNQEDPYEYLQVDDEHPCLRMQTARREASFPFRWFASPLLASGIVFLVVGLFLYRDELLRIF